MIPKLRQQLRIVDRADAVADPLRADRERIPDALRVRGLARVARQAQPAIARLRVQIAKPQRGTFRLDAADADRDHSIAHVLRREIEHRRGRFRSPLARRVENPADRNGTPRGFVRQRVEDRAQVLLLPQDHAGG